LPRDPRTEPPAASATATSTAVPSARKAAAPAGRGPARARKKIKPSSPGRLAAVTCASATPRSSRTVLEHGWFRQEPPPVISIAAG
jgi:hypothetical protein